MTEDGSNVVPFKPKTSPPPPNLAPPHPLIFSPEILSSSLLEYLAMAKTAGLEPELAVISMVMYKKDDDSTHLVSFSHPTGLPLQDVGVILQKVVRDVADRELASVLHGLRAAKSSESTT